MSRKHSLAEVSELIKYTLFTDYLDLDLAKKEVPISLLIIANAESGKTSVVDQFYPATGLLRLGDVTAYGLEKYFLEGMKDGSIKRLFIPDLINSTSRKKETVDTLITFLNSYISWEGVTAIATYAMKLIDLKEPLRGSLISTVTPQDFNRIWKAIAATGFLSRLIPVSYAYAETTTRDIFKDIFEQNDGWGKIKLDLPTDKTAILLKPILAKQLEGVARLVGKQASVYGFRAARALMMLCKAKALSEGRQEANQEDIDRVIYLATKFVKLPASLEIK